MTDTTNAKRLLVIANETIAGAGLHARIKEMLAEDGEVLVIAPALSSRIKYVFSDVDGPREAALERLEQSLALLEKSGIKADGGVGDADPVRAFEDAVAVFEPDAVLISTHPEGRSNWLETKVVDKVRDKTTLPVAHEVVDVTAVESSAVLAGN